MCSLEWPLYTTVLTSEILLHSPVQSVKPPSTTITFPGDITLFPPTVITAVSGTSTTTQVCEQTSTATSGAVTTPAPILSGVTADCTKFHQAVEGDGCWAIENQYSISSADFISWNPAVGTDCANGVWLTYYYCVAVSGGSSTTTQAACGGDYIFPGGSISPVFHTTSHVITIQPQATVSVTSPDPPGSIKYRTTTSSGPLPSWESTEPGCDGCGDWDCTPFGCPPGISPPDGGGGGLNVECGLFGCDGGCGILGCAGLCRFFGCGCKGNVVWKPMIFDNDRVLTGIDKKQTVLLHPVAAEAVSHQRSRPRTAMSPSLWSSVQSMSTSTHQVERRPKQRPQR